MPSKVLSRLWDFLDKDDCNRLIEWKPISRLSIWRPDFHIKFPPYFRWTKSTKITFIPSLTGLKNIYLTYVLMCCTQKVLENWVWEQNISRGGGFRLTDLVKRSFWLLDFDSTFSLSDTTRLKPSASFL